MATKENRMNAIATDLMHINAKEVVELWGEAPLQFVVTAKEILDEANKNRKEVEANRAMGGWSYMGMLMFAGYLFGVREERARRRAVKYPGQTESV